MSGVRVERQPARQIAYFSMEIGLEPDMPTYSGGLGVLAGDTLKAAADLVLGDAKGHEHNTFKIELARRAMVRALSQAAAGTPQSQVDKRIH